MTNSLQLYIEKYIHLDQSEFELFCDYLEVREFDKKLYLLEEGKKCQHKFFLLNGLVRTFYVDSDGNEKITLFGKEHWWVTDMDSFINESPSRVNIQAIENTTALVISKQKLEEVYEKIPKIERLFRIISEKWLIAQQRNSHFFMKANSRERYNVLVNAIPDFVQRVPQYMIASYLDISPEYLSELRRSKG